MNRCILRSLNCKRLLDRTFKAGRRLIKGGLPTEAMVASVLVAKYAWDLPLYRQSQMLAAQGLDIKRSVLAFWVGYAAAELEPLYLRLRELILGSGKIAVDETKAPVLDPGRGRVKQGYFWAIARDDRPWGGTDPPAIAFTYAPGRGAVHALKLLDGYGGVVQCDGYSAYKKLAAEAPGEAVTLAFCWSHLRRRFYDHAKSGFTALVTEDGDPATPKLSQSSIAPCPDSWAFSFRRSAALLKANVPRQQGAIRDDTADEGYAISVKPHSRSRALCLGARELLGQTVLTLEVERVSNFRIVEIDAFRPGHEAAFGNHGDVAGMVRDMF
jgi:hypothetical protein